MGNPRNALRCYRCLSRSPARKGLCFPCARKALLPVRCTYFGLSLSLALMGLLMLHRGPAHTEWLLISVGVLGMGASASLAIRDILLCRRALGEVQPPCPPRIAAQLTEPDEKAPHVQRPGPAANVSRLK